MSNESRGAIDLARSTIKEVLSKYFRSSKRLNSCTDEMTTALAHMLTVHPVKKRPKGATVMTEAAAFKKQDGTFSARPQDV